MDEQQEAQALPHLARVASLDVGDRRVGIALSDELGLAAHPLLTYNCLPNKRDATRDAKSILRLLRKAGCRLIVVGHPLRLSGSQSSQTLRVERFASILRETSDVPVVLWDERLSTAAAHEILDRAGHAPRGREDVIDQVAAVLILEGYMEAHRTAPLLQPSPGQTVFR